MGVGGWHRRCAVLQEWCAFGARALLLALAMFIVSTVAGSGDDLADHGGRYQNAIGVGTLVTPMPTEAGNPGLACRLLCGCHQVAPLQVSSYVTPSTEFAGLGFSWVAEVPTSVTPDRLARPPRA